MGLTDPVSKETPAGEQVFRRMRIAPAYKAVSAEIERIILSGALEPGASKQGVYVFQVPPSGQASLTVEINYSGSPNVVLVRR